MIRIPVFPSSESTLAYLGAPVLPLIKYEKPEYTYNGPLWHPVLGVGLTQCRMRSLSQSRSLSAQPQSSSKLECSHIKGRMERTRKQL